MVSLPRDFKSLASADSAILAYLFIFYRFYTIRRILSPLRLPVSPYSQICSCAVEIATSALNYIRSRTLCQDFCRQCAPFAAPQRRFAAHICMRKHCPNYTNNMMTPTRSPTNIAKAGALERHIRMDSGSSSPKTTEHRAARKTERKRKTDGAERSQKITEHRAKDGRRARDRRKNGRLPLLHGPRQPAGPRPPCLPAH